MQLPWLVMEAGIRLLRKQNLLGQAKAHFKQTEVVVIMSKAVYISTACFPLHCLSFNSVDGNFILQTKLLSFIWPKNTYV